MARKSFPVAEVWVRDPSPPTTPTQALMEAAPGEDVQESTMERSDADDPRTHVLAEFTDVERDILYMWLEGLSTNEIASMLGISRTWLHTKRLSNLIGRFEALRQKYGSDSGSSTGS